MSPRKQGWLARLLQGWEQPEAESEDSIYAEPEDYDPLPVLKLRTWDYGWGADTSREGYGFETPDGKIWTVGKCMWSLWSELGILHLPVIGESFHMDELQGPGFKPGSAVLLVSEPENPHDPKAISIRDSTGTKRCGYIKKGNTSRLRNLLRDQDFMAMAIAATYSDEKPRERRSLKIVVFRPDRLSNCPDLPLHPSIDLP